ncbi:MAG: reverse transcriptase/maturase family protein [Oscillospiraceae bacterium]|nr:reverse transcriptase/maturase family protein [Oscillospiraceae bacterium]
MGILDAIQDEQIWRDFLRDRLERGRFTREEERFFVAFVETGAFREAARRVAAGALSAPQKRLLNKHGSAKKRVVYTFSPEEKAVLKLIGFLLYRYDGAMPPNLYSFRRSCGAKSAVRALCATPELSSLWCCKLDIKNYFNSIPCERLLPRLGELLADDAPLLHFFESLLLRDEALVDGLPVREKRGVMAGTPTSPFLANIYLLPLDRYFERIGAPYARYSDDIVVFARSEEALAAYREHIARALAEDGLSINPDKQMTAAPGEAWSFLGVQYHVGTVDLAPATVAKLKGKIRRKARALYRWKLRKSAQDERAMKAFARAMNRKLFEAQNDADRFTWSRWFFPLVTTDRSLKILDAYMQEHMRYIATGRFSRSNYRVRYETLKACGLRSLVGEYYKYKKAGFDDNT